MNIKAKKREAVDFLNQRGRRIDLVFFGLVLIFACIAPIFLYYYVAYLVSSIVVGIVGDMRFSEGVAHFLSSIAPITGIVFALAFVVFITCPIMYRFFAYTYRMHRQGIAGNPKFLEKGGYFKSVFSGAVSTSVLLACFLPVFGLYKFAVYVSSSTDKFVSNLGSGIFVFVILIGIILGFCVFLLFRPIFLFGYFSAKGQNVPTAIKSSCKTMKNPRAKKLYNSYMKSFAPELLLALPTFLVLFFINTLPKMIIVYYKLCDELVYSEKYN